MPAGDYQILDPRFNRLFNGSAHVERLFTGCRWAEGPAWFAAGRYLVWSDIPNDRMLRYDECDGSVSVFRQPCGNANGNTVDRQGRLVSCEHSGRRVSRTEHDGRVITIADRWQGKRLNSPNDVVVRSDGSIWFTDPAYGIETDYEGDKAESEIGACYVYRVDPDGTVWPFRWTRGSSMWSTPAARTDRKTRRISASSMWTSAARFPAAACSPTAPPDCSTGFASTMPDGYGPARRTASTATTPTAR
jgi:streptogramin lyase